MSKIITTELTEEARAHVVCHAVGMAMLAGRFNAALEQVTELWTQPNTALAEQSAMKKICRAIDPAASDYADYVEGNRQAAEERRN